MIDMWERLAGTWAIDRTISDHHAGLEGAFRGRANVEATSTDAEVPQMARYTEVGTLAFGGHSGPASRALTFVRDGRRVAVHFADMRPFVDLDLTDGTARATYLCGSDAYEITMTVESTDVLVERWRVRGPTKAYDAVTVWTREPSPTAD